MIGENNWLPQGSQICSVAPKCYKYRVTKFADALDQLSTRSFGGVDVAVDPTSSSVSDEFFGSGPLPCGVDESIAWFLQGVNSTDQCLRMIFLVGGPGNGKSFVAGQISKNLAPLDIQNSEISHREYRYQSGAGSLLRVINDASIINPADQSLSGSSLANDILSAISTSSHLMVNVNRGVLYRELTDGGPANLGKGILQWVAQSRSDFFSTDSNVSFRSFDANEVLHFAKIEIDSPEINLEIITVHLDAYSLLERKPKFLLPDHEREVPEVEGGYSIQKLSDRDMDFTSSTPAGDLVGNFFDRFPLGEDLTNPLVANVANLKNPKIQSGLLTIFRAAEIATNRRFSYRDLWGLIAESVIGQKEVRGSTRASEWMAQPILESDPISEQIETIKTNASMRFHQALVGSMSKNKRENSTRQITNSHAVEAVRKVDPAIDARVGGIYAMGEQSRSNETSWADQIMDALSATPENSSYVGSILSVLPAGHTFRDSITPFELMIDGHICRIMNSKSLARDNERRGLLAWYGEYLIRLFAFSQGFPAFYEEITEWILGWRTAVANGRLTNSIESGLKALLLPEYRGLRGRKEVLLPIFASKTEPLIERTVEKVVAMEFSGTPVFDASVAADGLLVELKVDRESVVTLNVDFSLVREILNCTSESPGASEESVISVPRIERIRSAMLVSGRENARIYVVEGVRLEEITPKVNR